MALQLCIYLNRELQDKLAARQGFDPKKSGEKEAHAKPIYRTLDRAFSALEQEQREMAGKFTIEEWQFFIKIAKLDIGLHDMAVIIHHEARLSELSNDSKGRIEATDFNDLLTWAILDTVERFHAAGDITADADGLKKLGILCRE